MAGSYSSSASLEAIYSRFNTKKRSWRVLATPFDATANGICKDESTFQALLTFERRRAERSLKPFILMLLKVEKEDGPTEPTLPQVIPAMASCIRETDLLGWYKSAATLGIIFTELGEKGGPLSAETLRMKIQTVLQDTLGPERAQKISISFHVFPDKLDPNGPEGAADSKLYPDVHRHAPLKKISLTVKRSIDIAGSFALLVLLSPLLAFIALIIKLTSKGPVLFAQERLGQFGVLFKCLKFRTMHVNCDSQLHQDYVQKLIAGKADSGTQKPNAQIVYKITSDPRVTWIGRLLRRTSLDELPQLWNVLRGQMSLVGPRPPVPYEFEMYDIWHRRRVLETPPGITGLWQVSGRSRIRFDDMVRLDVRYCQSWSLWLDLKILLATPWVVISGDGAY